MYYKKPMHSPSIRYSIIDNKYVKILTTWIRLHSSEFSTLLEMFPNHLFIVKYVKKDSLTGDYAWTHVPVDSFNVVEKYSIHGYMTQLATIVFPYSEGVLSWIGLTELSVLELEHNVDFVHGNEEESRQLEAFCDKFFALEEKKC